MNKLPHVFTFFFLALKILAIDNRLCIPIIIVFNIYYKKIDIYIYI